MRPTGSVFEVETKQAKADLVREWLEGIGDCFGVASSPLAGVQWLLQPCLCQF